MSDVRTLLKKRPLLFDGGMGTYYKGAPGRECEQANRLDPEGIRAVHRAYLAAGADAIKTNTFGLPRLAAGHAPGWEKLADAGWKLAAEAAAETGAAVFADLGPAPDTEAVPAAQVYTAVAERFAALGAKNFLFETLSSDVGILEAVRAVKAQVPEAFVLVSFAVLPDGYTREGVYCKDLVRRMTESGCVDAVGLNCVSAPGAMRTLARGLAGGALPLSVMPNAGYPVVTRTQVRYQGKPEYFARELSGLAAEGAVDGIEVYHPSNSAEDSAECLALCKQYGLVATAGTDFHGRNHKHPHPIGTCTAPDEAAAQLRAIAEKRKRERT